MIPDQLPIFARQDRKCSPGPHPARLPVIYRAQTMSAVEEETVVAEETKEETPAVGEEGVEATGDESAESIDKLQEHGIGQQVRSPLCCHQSRPQPLLLRKSKSSRRPACTPWLRLS